MSNVNIVVLVGNLTRDPELQTTGGGTNVCKLRLAVNDRVKDRNTGEWSDRPNYFDVDVFGSTAEHCSAYLSKGRQVAVEGKLRWREWETNDGSKRQAVSVVANNVQFIGARDKDAGGGQSFASEQKARFEKAGLAPKDYEDDDIPFD